MKRNKSGLNQKAPAGQGNADIHPELEACLRTLVPDHDPRDVQAAMSKALRELSDAQSRTLH